jgi:hypothetical protein
VTMRADGVPKMGRVIASLGCGKSSGPLHLKQTASWAELNHISCSFSQGWLSNEDLRDEKDYLFLCMEWGPMTLCPPRNSFVAGVRGSQPLRKLVSFACSSDVFPGPRKA